MTVRVAWLYLNERPTRYMTDYDPSTLSGVLKRIDKGIIFNDDLFRLGGKGPIIATYEDNTPGGGHP